MSETIEATWAPPAEEPAVGRGRTEADVAAWRLLTSRLRETAIAYKWSKSEVSRRSGMPVGTLSGWYNGAYQGRLDTTNLRIEQWLDSVEEAGALARAAGAAPGYVPTRTAREVEQTLAYAQMLGKMAVVTLGAGMGKTFAAKQYCNTRPNAHLVTMSPATRKVHGMLMEIAASLGVLTFSSVGLHREIGRHLSRAPNTLLIIDEAQNLEDTAVDQARSFMDLYTCGIALVGNEEIYSRFERKADGPSYAQIRRRMGKRLRRAKPYAEDIAVYIDAWGVDDAGARKFLSGVGMKAGALGEIDETMRLASILAAGEGGAVTETHVKAAWKNRGMED